MTRRAAKQRPNQATHVSMKWSEVGSQACSVARTLSVIGDRWTPLVLREAFRGATRFEEFLEGVGASRAIVTERLAKLVEDGVLSREPYQDNPPRHTYTLTPKGRDLLPVLLTLQEWGDRWLDDGDGPPFTLVHSACGKRTHARLHCTQCDEPLGFAVRSLPRPGSWARDRKRTRAPLRPRRRRA